MPTYTVALSDFEPIGISIIPVVAYMTMIVKRDQQTVCTVHWINDQSNETETLSATQLLVNVDRSSSLDFAIAVWQALLERFNEPADNLFEVCELFENGEISIDLP